MTFATTYANRHQPMYSAEDVIQAGMVNLNRGFELLEFNRMYPTRRDWHHRVRLEFGQPCDPICKPQRTYTGDSLIQRIKARYRIEDVAARLTRLRGSGNVLKGRCPLHNEQSGEAFQIRIEQQDWRCWGRCQAHGDVIDLARECGTRGINWRGRNTEGDG